MDKQKRILNKILQIERLIGEIKKDINAQITAKELGKRKKLKNEAIPRQEELKNLYENMYQAYIENRQNQIIEEIEQKTKNFLAAFCKANSLPIDGSKASKKKISEEVINWLSQKKAIMKEVR